MKVLVQRVTSASVAVDGQTVGEIGKGLLLFVGFTHGDNPHIAGELASKAVNLRIFEGQTQRLDYSVLDTDGEVLAVPQFTLYALTSRGRRPDFTQAMAPDAANQLFGQFVDALNQLMETPVATGIFGANMEVSLVNDGPFTVMLERNSA